MSMNRPPAERRETDGDGRDVIGVEPRDRAERQTEHEVREADKTNGEPNALGEPPNSSGRDEPDKKHRR